MLTPPPDRPRDTAWLVMSRGAEARFPSTPLRAYLDAEAITHAQVAELAGTTEEAVRQALYGNQRFTASQAARLCRALGIAPSAVWANWTELCDLRVWEPMPWARRARCRGEDATEMFFSPPNEMRDAREAREFFVIAEYCSQCCVIAECRDYARRNREYGVWGGETEEDRTAAGAPPPDPGSRLVKWARAIRHAEELTS